MCSAASLSRCFVTIMLTRTPACTEAIFAASSRGPCISRYNGEHVPSEKTKCLRFRVWGLLQMCKATFRLHTFGLIFSDIKGRGVPRQPRLAAKRLLQPKMFSVLSKWLKLLVIQLKNDPNASFFLMCCSTCFCLLEFGDFRTCPRDS